MALIALTTDFGRADHYVAAMKGVILQLAPQVRIVDVSHEIRRHDILHGAFVLQQTLPWYPAGTVHAVVVDPGVGGSRRILVARYAGQVVIVPDNGIISLVHHQFPVQEVRVLDNPQIALAQVSPTFHGRDVIAPAAAHLANGTPLRNVGPATDHVEILPIAAAEWRSPDRLCGAVVHTDGFGNLITNLTSDEVHTALRRIPEARIFVDEAVVGPLSVTFSDVPVGDPVAYIGSGNQLEIAVNAASAAERFQISPGTVVEIRNAPPPLSATS